VGEEVPISPLWGKSPCWLRGKQGLPFPGRGGGVLVGGGGGVWRMFRVRVKVWLVYKSLCVMAK